MNRLVVALLLLAAFVLPQRVAAQTDKSSRDLIYPVNPPRKAGSNPPLAKSQTPSPGISWSPFSSTPTPVPGERLLKIDSVEKSGGPGEDQKFTVSISRTSPKDVVADKVKVLAYFYEKSAADSVELTESRVISSWATPPIDWGNAEVLELLHPTPAKDSGKSFYGCTVAVFHRDVLQEKWKSSPDLP